MPESVAEFAGRPLPATRFPKASGVPAGQSAAGAEISVFSALAGPSGRFMTVVFA